MKQKINNSPMATKYGLKVLMVGLALLSLNLCRGATVTFSNNVAAAQSSTDAIEGMYTLKQFSTARYLYYTGLTDGLMSGASFSYNTSDILTFAYAVPSNDVYVSQVDVWVSAADYNRAGMDIDIAFSSNGVSYTEVITGSYTPPTYGSLWNLGRFKFDPEETRGMSYIRIISTNCPSAPRVDEIDVFTVPERSNHTKSFSIGIDLDQSATDDINGVLPNVMGSGERYSVNAALTDAASETSPTASTLCMGDYNIVTSTWDLVSVVKARTFLDRVDFWLPIVDTFRGPIRFGIIVSSDGSTWRYVADTGYRASLSSYNRIRIDFDRRAITDFRYIGIIDYPFYDGGKHAPIIEIDVFTDAPSGTLLIIK